MILSNGLFIQHADSLSFFLFFFAHLHTLYITLVCQQLHDIQNEFITQIPMLSFSAS